MSHHLTPYTINGNDTKKFQTVGLDNNDVFQSSTINARRIMIVVSDATVSSADAGGILVTFGSAPADPTTTLNPGVAEGFVVPVNCPMYFNFNPGNTIKLRRAGNGGRVYVTIFDLD